MSHKIHNGCRELWVQVVYQACSEAKARLAVARDVREVVRHCEVLNQPAQIHPYDHELSRIEAYFNGQDFRDICLWAGLRCDPAAAIAYATGQWSERVAA